MIRRGGQAPANTFQAKTQDKDIIPQKRGVSALGTCSMDVSHEALSNIFSMLSDTSLAGQVDLFTAVARSVLWCTTA